MNVIVVDTSSWISFFRSRAPSASRELIEEALGEGRAYLSPIVASELLSGTKLTNSAREKLREFLQQLPLCVTPLEHWMCVGELRAKLLLEGLSVSTPDAHVAQCALDLNGYLLSLDEIFQRIVENKIPLRLA